MHLAASHHLAMDTTQATCLVVVTIALPLVLVATVTSFGRRIMHDHLMLKSFLVAGVVLTSSFGVVLAAADDEQARVRMRVEAVDKSAHTVSVAAAEGKTPIKLRVTDDTLLARLKAGDEVMLDTKGKRLSIVVDAPFELVETPEEALARARDEANAAKCGANLRQLGMALQMYAASWRGRYPPDLAALGAAAYIEDPSCLICPAKKQPEIPKDFATMEPAAKGKWIAENCTYVYAGAGKREHTAQQSIVAYEKPGSHLEGDHVYAVFGDGHFESLSPQQWAEHVKKDKSLEAKPQ